MPASAIRAVQRATSRSWAPVSCAVGAGETSRSARARAASVSVSARSRPVHGNVDDPVARVGRAVDRQSAAPLAVLEPQPPDPGDDAGDVVRPLARRDVGPEADQRVSPRVALAVPGPAPADGHLDLDHRLQPVDVRALEQTDLDQSHGPGRIASRHGQDTRLDWPPRRTA